MNILLMTTVLSPYVYYGWIMSFWC